MIKTMGKLLTLYSVEKLNPMMSYGVENLQL